MARKKRPTERAPHKAPPAASESQSGERLQKVLAAAGLGSRRECEQLIVEGRVEIDRQVVVELGTRVDSDQQDVRVDGAALQRRRHLYYAVNKPPGVVCTNRDPDGRMRVIDLINSDERLFTIGRLDRSSEGLILVTNDGELANRLTHPRYGIEKVYRVRVVGHPDPGLLRRLEQGLHLADGFAKVASARVKRRHRDATELEVVLNEGRNREIRRLLARVGHKVVELKRVAMGPVRLEEMPSGAYRQLSPQEVKKLRNAGAKGSSRQPRPARKKSRRASSHGSFTAVPAKPKGRPVRRAEPVVGTVLEFEEKPDRPVKAKRVEKVRSKSHVVKPRPKGASKQQAVAKKRGSRKRK